VGMPKRFHLNRPDRAKEVIAALADCEDVSDQTTTAGDAPGLWWAAHRCQIAEQWASVAASFSTGLGCSTGWGGGPVGQQPLWRPAPKVTGKVLEAFQAGLKVDAGSGQGNPALAAQ